MINFGRWLVPIGTVLVFFSLAYPTKVALACSCAADATAIEALRSYDQIFDGVVETVADVGDDQKEATLIVTKVWKGRLGDTTKLRFHAGEGTSCAMSFPVGTSGRFYTTGRASGPLWTGWCSWVIPDSLNQQGQFQKELDSYGAQLTKLRDVADRGSKDDRIKLGDFLLRSGDEEQALDVFREVAKIDPNDAQVWLRIGDSASKLGELEESAAALKRATTLSPDSHGPASRTAFETTGKLDPNWKDWSGLTTRGGCEGQGEQIASATFAGSTLSECSFSGAVLTDVNFTGSKLYRVTFDGAALKDIQFENVDLQGTFHAATLANIVMSGSVYADFSLATLSNIKATGLQTSSLDLSGAHLSDVDLSHSSLQYADIRNALLVRVNLKDASLFRADLRGADLSSADVQGAKFDAAHIDCATRLPPSVDERLSGIIQEEPVCFGKHQNRDFSNRSWRHADFGGLSLVEANFSGSDLSLASLRRADLRRANLSGTIGLGDHGGLWGANLDGAHIDDAKDVNFLTGTISLRGTTFRGTILHPRFLVSDRHPEENVDLDEPNFDGVVLDCSELRTDWFHRQSAEAQTVIERHWRKQIAVIRTIQAKWPSARLTSACSDHIAAVEK